MATTGAGRLTADHMAAATWSYGCGPTTGCGDNEAGANTDRTSVSVTGAHSEHSFDGLDTASTCFAGRDAPPLVAGWNNPLTSTIEQAALGRGPAGMNPPTHLQVSRSPTRRSTAGALSNARYLLSWDRRHNPDASHVHRWLAQPAS
ncbi:MAG: hypothetical protein ACRDYY_12630 [Acidimicrobiales bacterium]